jgi:hypothetical protein
MLVSFLGHTFAHAHVAQTSLPTDLSQFFSAAPDKGESAPTKHHSITCSCLSTVLPANGDVGSARLEKSACKHRPERGTFPRSVRSSSLIARLGPCGYKDAPSWSLGDKPSFDFSQRAIKGP